MDSYLGEVEHQMKDIHKENQELKKMLKDMYKVHINSKKGKMGMVAMESTDKSYDQLDIHINEKTGSMTQAKYKRSRSRRKVSTPNKVRGRYKVQIPQDNAMGDTINSNKPIGYGTFGKDSSNLTPVRMSEFKDNNISKLRKELRISEKNMPLTPSNDKKFFNRNIQSKIELEKAQSLLGE